MAQNRNEAVCIERGSDVTTSNNTLENGLGTLRFARQVTLDLLRDIREDQAIYQPISGGNHALWIAGHLARNDDWFLRSLKPRDSRLPKEWDAQFGPGSTVQADTSAYPPFGTVLEHMADLREELMAWFAARSLEDLNRPLAGELARFGDSYGHLMSTLAWHEGLHAGQLTVIRKGLKLKPRFG